MENIHQEKESVARQQNNWFYWFIYKWYSLKYSQIDNSSELNELMKFHSLFCVEITCELLCGFSKAILFEIDGYLLDGSEIGVGFLGFFD